MYFNTFLIVLQLSSVWLHHKTLAKFYFKKKKNVGTFSGYHRGSKLTRRENAKRDDWVWRIGVAYINTVASIV